MRYKKWDKVILTNKAAQKYFRDIWNIYTIQNVYDNWYKLVNADGTWYDEEIKWLASENFTEGEVVEVRDWDEDNWKEKIYLTTLPWKAVSKYIVINKYDEEQYKNWKQFNWDYCDKIRKLQPKEVKEYTMKEIQEKLWEEFKLVKE